MEIREISPDLRGTVEVYRNLHNGLWSVRQKGRIVGHVERVLIYQPRFVVQESGRQRVLASGKKNVHAFVRGQYSPLPAKYMDKTLKHHERASYDPYKRDRFFMVDNGKPIEGAEEAVLIHSGLWKGLWVSHPLYSPTLSSPVHIPITSMLTWALS